MLVSAITNLELAVEMRKFPIILITQTVIAALLFQHSANADIEWSGVYRIEGHHIKNSELRSQGKELSYGLHHLVLRPKIVAGDGLMIFGQFDILNEATNYKNSQMGQVWGSGVRDSSTTAASATNSAEDSNTLSERQRAETIEVSQLYLTLTQEYGTLIVGRAPLQFGLGMTYSAGRGLFDHWYDSSDMVGYKVIVGNLSFTPMLAKPSEGDINNSDDVTDMMFQFQYDNPETDMELGVFYKVRRSGDQGSDGVTPAAGSSTGSVLGGANSTNTARVNAKTVNIYALKDTGVWRAGVEASFLSGDTGVVTSGGEKVGYDGFGVAGEFGYNPEGSKFNWSLLAGIASGDDPSTDGKFEGYIFDRNYDVAMLMFNHPLGQDDFLRTKLITGSVYDNASDKNINRADVEAISNVFYVVPKVRYIFNDRWSLDNSLAMGWLNTQPIPTKSTDKNLGYEWDISLNFSPRKGVQWLNQVGYLFPGDAWKGEDLYKNSNAFGLMTKAAISF